MIPEAPAWTRVLKAPLYKFFGNMLCIMESFVLDVYFVDLHCGTSRVQPRRTDYGQYQKLV